MEEIKVIYKKYINVELPEIGSDLADLHKFSEMFYSDVAEVYEILTRLRHPDRNPTGFDLKDAPILGLLIKISKLLQEIVIYYKAGDANQISYLERQAIEAGIIAQYLISSDATTLDNYRKCSFKERLNIYSAPETEGFYATKAGRRIKDDIERQFEEQGFTQSSFEVQKKHQWKVDGKSVRNMFDALGLGEIYSYAYGFTSESTHASWGHSLNFELKRNSDGTYLPHPTGMPSDIRYFSSLVEICNPAFIGWSKRVGLGEHDRSLMWIAGVNRRLLDAYDAVYEGTDG